ncbi:hypothetical protein D3C73_1302640 [compost metagenome]
MPGQPEQNGQRHKGDTGQCAKLAVDTVNHVIGVDRPPYRQRGDQQRRITQQQLLVAPQEPQ